MAFTSDQCLAGKLLIAMPGIGDPRFERAVIFICAHSEMGAMGLIVNKPIPDLALSGFLATLDLPSRPELAMKPVYAGGPVEAERGFVLHTADQQWCEDTLVVNRSFAMTATIPMLKKIAEGDGPAQCLVALGYAGWGPGQLDKEILSNGWLSVTPGPRLVFNRPDEQKWSDALHLLGVAPQGLSSAAGHA